MKLSDAFELPVENPALELRVIQLNINAGYNKELMEKCRTLREYSLYVDRVRKYAKERPLAEAVEHAVQECIKEGILEKFLSRYRREAVSVSIFEYDEEKEMALIRKAEREAGVEVGIEQGLADGLERGLATGIEAFISLCQEINLSSEEIIARLISKFAISEDTAKNYLEKYWHA